MAVADISEEAAREAAAAIQAERGRDAAVAVAVDVASSGQVRSMVERTLSAFGRIDILVNNAGIGVRGDILESSEEDFQAVFDVNVKGAFLCCKAVLPPMISQGGGAIVNVSSVAALVGVKDRPIYGASKGALLALTKGIAVDHVHQGIRCNCVCPGTVETPWIGKILSGLDDPEAARKAMEARQLMGRMGRPEEIAQAILYLASPEASFVTGAALVADGGMTAV